MDFFLKGNVVLVLLTFTSYTHQQVHYPAFLEKWNSVRADCGTKEGYDVGAAQKFWDDNSFPEDAKLKCFYNCTWTALGVLDQNGDVVDDALGYVSSHFNDQATKQEIVEECGHLNGADLCDISYQLLKCIKATKLD